MRHQGPKPEHQLGGPGRRRRTGLQRNVNKASCPPFEEHSVNWNDYSGPLASKCVPTVAVIQSKSVNMIYPYIRKVFRLLTGSGRCTVITKNTNHVLRAWILLIYHVTIPLQKKKGWFEHVICIKWPSIILNGDFQQTFLIS